MFRWTGRFNISRVNGLTRVLEVVDGLRNVAVSSSRSTLMVLSPFLMAIIRTLRVISTSTLLRVSTSLLSILRRNQSATLSMGRRI